MSELSDDEIEHLVNVSVGTIWNDIKSFPRNGGDFFALGDSEIASVRYEPQCGCAWVIRNIPGGGERISNNLDIFFHSWCRFSDLHETLNRRQNPDYYS